MGRGSRCSSPGVCGRRPAAGTIETHLIGNGGRKIPHHCARQARLEIPEGKLPSPHGMRGGFITEAYLNGALDEQVMTHAWQKDVNTMRSYRRRAKTVAASPTRFMDF